jgi:hypothetical protein
VEGRQFRISLSRLLESSLVGVGTSFQQPAMCYGSTFTDTMRMFTSETKHATSCAFTHLIVMTRLVIEMLTKPL